MLEMEAAAGIRNGVDEPETSMEARPELLVAVAGALQAMVGAMISRLMHKCSSRCLQFRRVVQEQSSSREETLMCASSRDSRAAKSGKGRTIKCKHTCEHHQEVVHSWTWRNELVALVFAQLPLPHIFRLCESSEAWSAMSSLSSIPSGALSERFPKLVVLLGWGPATKQFTATIYGHESQEWLRSAACNGDATQWCSETRNIHHQKTRLRDMSATQRPSPQPSFLMVTSRDRSCASFNAVQLR
jgi:hypothetical protein